jgi:hypothetical protein
MHQGGADRGPHDDAIAAHISITDPLANGNAHRASRMIVVGMPRFALIVLTCLLGVVLFWPRTAKDDRDLPLRLPTGSSFQHTAWPPRPGSPC